MNKPNNSLSIIHEINNTTLKSYLCLCVCGKKIIVSRYLLKRKKTVSCGCLFNSLPKKNRRNDRIYKLWNSIRRRCRDAQSKKYFYYGAKGIKMDDLWFNNFEEFHKEVGDYPEGLNLVLKDNLKGYSPGNCKWDYTDKE